MCIIYIYILRIFYIYLSYRLWIVYRTRQILSKGAARFAKGFSDSDSDSMQGPTVLHVKRFSYHLVI